MHEVHGTSFNYTGNLVCMNTLYVGAMGSQRAVSNNTSPDVQGKLLLVRSLNFCLGIFISPHMLVALVNRASSVKSTKLGKFGSVPHCCTNHWQNVIRVGKSLGDKACTAKDEMGTIALSAVSRQSCEKRSSVVPIVLCWSQDSDPQHPEKYLLVRGCASWPSSVANWRCKTPDFTQAAVDAFKRFSIQICASGESFLI